MHISGMAEARAVKFVHRETISSATKEMINCPQNGHGYGQVTHLLSYSP